MLKKSLFQQGTCGKLLVGGSIKKLELPRLVRALDRPRLHSVELDCASGQNDAGDARPEAREDDGLEQAGVGAVPVERGRGGRAACWHKVERGEGGEEVGAEGGDVSDCGGGYEVLVKETAVSFGAIR